MSSVETEGPEERKIEKSSSRKDTFGAAFAEEEKKERLAFEIKAMPVNLK